jgi:hypothetical protein
MVGGRTRRITTTNKNLVIKGSACRDRRGTGEEQHRKEIMEQRIPNTAANHWNKPVFDFLRDSSAHSDVTEALLQSVKPLGDVQSHCPDPFKYRYLVVLTRSIIFGFAIGMKTVGFRLNPPFNERALATGGGLIPELGEEWISFTLFRDDWPEVDLSFWARKAYVYARETENA